jgi:hypothetical protein
VSVAVAPLNDLFSWKLVLFGRYQANRRYPIDRRINGSPIESRLAESWRRLNDCRWLRRATAIPKIAIIETDRL